MYFMSISKDTDCWELAVAARRRCSAASSAVAVSTAAKCTSLAENRAQKRAAFPAPESVTCRKNWPSTANSQLRRRWNISDVSTNCPMRSSNHKWNSSSNCSTFRHLIVPSRRSAVAKKDAFPLLSPFSTIQNY